MVISSAGVKDTKMHFSLKTIADDCWEQPIHKMAATYPKSHLLPFFIDCKMLWVVLNSRSYTNANTFFVYLSNVLIGSKYKVLE